VNGMKKKAILALSALALSWSLTGNAASQCIESGESLVINPIASFEGGSVTVSYSLKRSDCTSTGSFSLPIAVGGPKGSQLGKCEGVRTKEEFSCSGSVALPAGFTGPLVIGVGGVLAETIVQPKQTQPVAEDMEVLNDEDKTLVIPLVLKGVGVTADSFELENLPDSDVGQILLKGTTVTFIPLPGWSGITGFSYRGKDQHGVYSNVANVRIVTSLMNDPPIVIPHPAIGSEDIPFTFTPVVKDIDGVDIYQLVVEAQGSHVVASVSDDRHSLKITPELNWNGEDVIKITAVDAAGEKSPVTDIRVVIQPVNDAPVVDAISINTDEDVAGRAPIIFTDQDGQAPYRFTVGGQPSKSIGGCGIDGNYVVFTPAKDWNGQTTCLVTAIDANNASSKPAVVTINVNPVPDKPVVQSTTVTMNQGASTSVILAVTDPDKVDTFSLSSTTPQDATFGSFSFSGSKLSVTLSPSFVGSRVIAYTAKDSFGLSSDAGFITVKVQPVNAAPVVDAIDALTSIETPVSVELTATDANHDSPLTFAIAQSVAPAAGSLTLVNNVLTFSPATGFVGTATSKVTATDTAGAVSASQTITFNVQADQIVAYDPDVPDSHAIVIVQQPPANVGVITAVGMNVSFVPVEGYFGPGSFKYKVRDTAGLESAVKDGVIIVEKTNYAPTSATADLTAYEGEASAAVTPTVADKNLYDAGQHTFTVPIQAMTGVAEVVSNKIIYNAPFGFQGKTSFKFIARDLAGAEVIGTANVTVIAKNFPPTMVALDMQTPEMTPVSGAPTVVDPNPTDTFTFKVLGTPVGGTAAAAGGKVSYTPREGWTGTDSFLISAKDAAGSTVIGLATVTVVPNNLAPEGLVGTITGLENTPAAPYYPVITDKNLNDQGQHLLKVVTQPANGSVAVTGNMLIFTPAKDFIGDDSFIVEATDLGGLKVSGSVAVHVLKNNLQPESAALSITTYENTKSAPFKPEVVDPNVWDSFSYEVVSQPSHGSVLASQNGYIYTPNPSYVGNDSFAFRVVDAGGEYIESLARVAVLRKNTPPTGLKPTTVYFYEGVGGKERLSAVDANDWGSHTFEVVSQPEHGYVWFNGNDEMNFKTDGRTQTSVVIKVTDQDGESVNVTVALMPKSIADVVDQMPIEQIDKDSLSTPAITKEFNRTDGRPGLMVTEPVAIQALGTDVIAFVEKTSGLGLKVGRKPLEPGQAVRLPIDRVTVDSLGAAVAALTAGEAGKGRLLLFRGDLTGSAFAIPYEVWSLQGAIKTSADSVPLGLQSVRAQFEPGNNVCLNTVRTLSAQNSNPYDNPVCLLEFTKPLPEYKDLSSDSTLALQGTAADVGSYPIEASSYIVGPDGQKYLLGTYAKTVTFVSPVATVKIGPKYPFDKAYFKVEDLDIEFVQQSGTACDLTIIERRAMTAASSYSTKPLCLVEWEEISPGLTIRPNWERPYLVGNAQMLGENKIQWKLSVFTPSGKKIDLGSDKFTFDVIEPSFPTVTYTSKTKVNDTLLVSPLAGGYIGDAVVTSVSARLQLKNNVNQGKVQSEEIAPSFGDIMTVYRRIYTAPYTALWQKRSLFVDVNYTLLPDLITHSVVDVLAVPDESIVPIIDNENGKILSTEALEVNVGIGDAYDSTKTYNESTMGAWEIRLIQKPTWNTVTEVAPWVRADGAGHASFALDVAALAGKNLRVFAEARIISPVPEYTVTRTSPQPLSLAILNGAALDGSIRALRLTGEAPLRVTLFADVTNRAWTKDLGNVRWEQSTEGGAWTEIPNKSRTPQRIALTLAKGKYKIRAELTNKHSGAKSMTDEIEIAAYNIPKGILKGAGNTFLDANARFRVLQVNAQPIDLSNIDVEWSYDRGVTWTPGSDSVVFTRSTEERVYVYMRMRYKDSPTDDPRVWKTIRSGVAFRKVRPPRVQLIGPRRPEVGKESTWVANLLMPYPNMDLTMDGEFIMPDGKTIVPGQEAKYTPVDSDVTDQRTYLSYRAWINGYRDRGGEGITQQRITFWIYDWPAWAISPTFSAEYAPADLSLRVRNIGEFKAVEGVYYDWEMPAMPGYSVVKDDNMALRILTIDEPGEFPFKVHVYDARGNYTLVEKNMTFKEPPPWSITLKWTGDNNAARAPLGIMVRPEITGGHPKDRITSMAYTLNGTEIDTGGSRYARATLPTEGQYQVAMAVQSQMNKGGIGEVSIDVKQNQKPTCDLQVKESGSAWTANAKCVDPDGRIARHNWFVNDKLQGLGGSMITISKRTYPEAPKILLYATDDSAEDSAPVVW